MCFRSKFKSVFFCLFEDDLFTSGMFVQLTEFGEIYRQINILFCSAAFMLRRGVFTHTETASINFVWSRQKSQKCNHLSLLTDQPDVATSSWMSGKNRDVCFFSIETYPSARIGGVKPPSVSLRMKETSRWENRVSGRPSSFDGKVGPQGPLIVLPNIPTFFSTKTLNSICN